jgi:ketosteroid isomerase-like protein
MSQENVENLRRCFALANDQGIEAAVEAFSHLIDDEFGLEEAAEMIDRDRYAGREGFIANMRKLDESLEEIRIEPLEFVDLGDRLVVVVSMSGRGKGSGAPVEVTFAQLWSMRDGKAVGLRDYATKSEALEAVALRE